MVTLVSLGTNAAYFFSVAVTLWPHVFHAAGAMTYYETAAVVITLVVLGRWLEARARGRTSEAIRRLVSLAPRTARVLRERRRGGRADGGGARSATSSASAPASGCPSTASSIEGALHGRRVDADRREPARRQGARRHACSAAR